MSELGDKALSLPEDSTKREPSQGARWGLLAGGAALAVVVVAAWYAGRVSGALDDQRLSAELNRVKQQAASTQLRLDEQRAKTRNLEKAMQSSGTIAAVDQQSLLQRRLLQAQAQIGQYKAILDREQHQQIENTRLLTALWNPGARLLPMKGANAAAAATAYAIFVENSSLFFIGANLPQLSEGRQFQLWIVRKQDPKIVSAGFFSPDDDHRAVIDFDEASLLSDVSAVAVTDEPSGGSPNPTGAKLLEASLSGEE